jgi:hypothetical protein
MPEQRSRLTVGVRKEQGRWVVVHEHRSFADITATTQEPA